MTSDYVDYSLFFLLRMYKTMTEADIILRITEENLHSDTNNENVGILDNVNGNDNSENTSSQDKSWFLQLDNCEVEEKHLDIRYQHIVTCQGNRVSV